MSLAAFIYYRAAGTIGSNDDGLKLLSILFLAFEARVNRSSDDAEKGFCRRRQNMHRKAAAALEQ